MVYPVGSTCHPCLQPSLTLRSSSPCSSATPRPRSCHPGARRAAPPSLLYLVRIRLPWRAPRPSRSSMPAGSRGLELTPHCALPALLRADRKTLPRACPAAVPPLRSSAPALTLTPRWRADQRGRSRGVVPALALTPWRQRKSMWRASPSELTGSEGAVWLFARREAEGKRKVTDSITWWWHDG